MTCQSTFSSLILIAFYNIYKQRRKPCIIRHNENSCIYLRIFHTLIFEGNLRLIHKGFLVCSENSWSDILNGCKQTEAFVLKYCSWLPLYNCFSIPSKKGVWLSNEMILRKKKNQKEYEIVKKKKKSQENSDKWQHAIEYTDSHRVC